MDQDELERLFRRYGAVIHARCRRMLGDGAAADDATQETFMRAHRHLQHAANSEEAVAWIYRVATNYCLNELRNRKGRPEPMEVLPEPVDPSAEARIADRDLVLRLVVRMPEKVAEPAWLYHVDGLEQAEIASVLGISRRTVVNRLAEFVERARKFLTRTAVGAEEEG